LKEATDWDAYYRLTPGYTQVTRRISLHKIAKLLSTYSSGGEVNVCELGGANSCFVEGLCKAVGISAYHVVDLNDYGLSLLRGKAVSKPLTWEKSDVLAPYVGQRKFDVVYSVGLIEHFQPRETTKAIEAHFNRCRPGGTVLMTFPTPTLPYKAIRFIAEATGKWSFPDERPLLFDEVIRACAVRGTVLHQSINWWIGLTQGYVVARSAF
jgi:hypothetical protein